MSTLDPLESPALRRELPTLKRAFDVTAIQEYLQSTLFDPHLRRYTIAVCELEQATYVPEDCCIVRYRLEIQDRSSGRRSLSLVSGRVFASEPTCHAYLHHRLAPLVPHLADREETLPFANPVATIAPLRMVVHAFPIDGELPTLIAATDRLRMTGILNDNLPVAMRHAAATETCQVEVVDYGRQHRATLRYVLAGGAIPAIERTIYGKLTADSSGALTGSITSALRDRARHSFHVPEAFAWLPDLRLSLLGAIPGKPGIKRALNARLGGKPELPGALSPEQMMEACARISATVHSLDLDLGPRRTLDHELLWLSRRIAEVRRISPELSLRLEPWLRQLLARAIRPALGGGLCHGDFTIGQVLFEGGESGLVDFDSACQGEPALDLGQFLAHLRIAGTHPGTVQSSVLAAELSERFLHAYVAALPHRVDVGRLADRVAVYKVVSLLRRAVRSWQKFKPGRVDAALTALQEEMAQWS